MPSTRRLLIAAGMSWGLCLTLGLASGQALANEDQPPGPREYFVEDIKSTMMKYIQDSVDGDGVFHMPDEKTGQTLSLRFVKIHDPVRKIGTDIYFACTDFHVVGEPDKLYDLDFWMNDKTGQLGVYESKVHKEPRWSWLYGWYKQPRYTFVNDEIQYLY